MSKKNLISPIEYQLGQDLTAQKMGSPNWNGTKKIKNSIVRPYLSQTPMKKPEKNENVRRMLQKQLQ